MEVEVSRALALAPREETTVREVRNVMPARNYSLRTCYDNHVRSQGMATRWYGVTWGLRAGLGKQVIRIFDEERDTAIAVLKMLGRNSLTLETKHY